MQPQEGSVELAQVSYYFINKENEKENTVLKGLGHKGAEMI